MRREWTLEALIESWTLGEADQELIGAKHGATKLGFCLLLKYFEMGDRSDPGEINRPSARWSPGRYAAKSTSISAGPPSWVKPSGDVGYWNCLNACLIGSSGGG